MDAQLLTGVVLIAAGVALGLMAYAIVLSRKDRESEGEVSDSSEPIAEPAADLTPPEPPPAPEPPGPSASPDSPASPAPAEPASAPLAPRPHMAPAAPAGAPPNRPALLVATLLRDEATGGLLVRVGDKEYRSAKELRASPDWTRMEYATADLQRWLSEAADRPRESPRDLPGGPPLTMIQQINEILIRKLEEAGQSQPGVRLADAGGGVVHVYVGFQRYEMGEVPDEGVRRLIRDAVAEWEARK